MKSILLVLFFLFLEIAPGSVLMEKDMKLTSFNKKNQGRKAPKKVFIRTFRALFEVYEEDAARTSGSKNERADRVTYTAGTSIKMGVQLSGVDVPDFQSVVDEAYNSFVGQLTSQGFEIVTAEEASKSEFFEGWTKVKGGASSEAQAQGFVMVTPNNFDYLVKSISGKGKEKSGGAFLDPTPKMSKSLGDVFIADVDVSFPFVSVDADGSKFTQSTSAKAKIDYQIAQIGPLGYTNIRFVSGLDIGNNPLFNAMVELKKPVSFDGVFADKKIYEVNQAKSEMFAKTGYTQLVMTSGDQKTVASHFAECNREAYVNAASGSMKDLIDAGLANFLELTKD